MEYPTLHYIIENLQAATGKPVVEIDLKKVGGRGKIKRESMECYLHDRSFSASNLNAALRSPRLFYYDYYARSTEKEIEADPGSLIHLALADPDLFQEEKKELGKTFFSGNVTTQEMIELVRNNCRMYGGGIIGQLLKGAISETSFYGYDPYTELPVKVRPHFLNVEENIGLNALISIQTTTAENLGVFATECATKGYDLTEGMCREVVSHITGRRFNTTFIIMVQTVPPFDVALLLWSPADIYKGREKYHYALHVVDEYETKKNYPGFEVLAGEQACGIIEFTL